MTLRPTYVLASLVILTGAIGAVVLDACRSGPDEAAEPAPIPLDSLSAEEEARFAVDPLRFPEMQDGRLDTVDMQASGGGATWHIQVLNYAPEHIAMTYAFWYSGPDSAALLAADGPPRLVDDRGNVYLGMQAPDNPRLRLERGTTGVGVFVFTPGLQAGADSLMLHVNDSTAPVLKVGPWGVFHEPERPGGVEVRPSD